MSENTVKRLCGIFGYCALDTIQVINFEDLGRPFLQLAGTAVQLSLSRASRTRDKSLEWCSRLALRLHGPTSIYLFVIILIAHVSSSEDDRDHPQKYPTQATPEALPDAAILQRCDLFLAQLSVTVKC